MWMNARRNWPASAQNVTAKILGEVMNAHVVMVCSTREKMICALVSF